MTRLLFLLALLAVSCATSRAREQPCPVCTGGGEMIVRPCPTVTRIVLSPLPTPPSSPKLEKMPAGCGPAFMACLTPEEDKKLRDYFQAVRNWAAEVYAKGCASGR
jgi:hypothetical protein